MQFPLSAILIECNSHCIKMRYSIEPRERRYVKGYGFLSFARNLNNKYGQTLADSAKKSAIDAIFIILYNMKQCLLFAISIFTLSNYVLLV